MDIGHHEVWGFAVGLGFCLNLIVVGFRSVCHFYFLVFRLPPFFFFFSPPLVYFKFKFFLSPPFSFLFLPPSPPPPVIFYP